MMDGYPPLYCMRKEMTRKWVSSSNTPDWVDVRSAMRGIEITHKCACYLEMMPGTTVYGPEMRLVLTAVSNEPGSGLSACEESTATSWPRGWSNDMTSTVFALVFELEARLTKRWWIGETYVLP